MTQKTLTAAAWISLLSLAFIWGFSFLAFALALRELPVFTLVAWRVTLGAIILWGVIFLLRVPIPRSPRVWGVMFVMGLLNNAIPFSLLAWGQIYVASGLASILNATTAFFAILIAAMVFVDEKLTHAKIIGVICAFIGVCFVIGPETLRNLDVRSLAQLALLGASLSYACAASWARYTFPDINPIMSATGMLTAASIVMVPLAICVDGVPSMVLTPTTWGAILFLGIPATAVAYLLYYRCLNLAGSGNLALVTLLVTPIAVVVGAFVLNEALPITAYLGFSLIALGMLVITKMKT